MSLLSDAEIDQMRATAEAAMPGTAVIQSRTYQSDGGGGGTAVWTPSGTAACGIAPLAASENAEPLTGGRVTPDSDWVITLPAQASISTEHRVVAGGRTFEVTALRAPRTFELTRRVEANEVQ